MNAATGQRPLHVWVLSDGRPGHYNLSRGIVAALNRQRPVETHWLALRLRAGFARNILRALLNHWGAPPVGMLKLFYQLPPLPDAPCDLIVSAGGKTSFANAWLARRLNRPNVFFGSLRRLSPALFKRILTLEPLVPAAANNLVLDLPPGDLDIEAIRQKGQALRERLAIDTPLWACLIGGDGAGYRYGEQDWQRLAELLNRLARRHGIRWLILSARRTGARAERILREGLDEDLVAEAYWYNGADPEQVQACLGAADALFVSEDSMTMLTEAIYAQRPVVSLRPQQVQSTARYEAMIERFSARGWLLRERIEALLQNEGELDVLACKPLVESPLADLSRALGEGFFTAKGAKEKL